MTALSAGTRSASKLRSVSPARAGRKALNAPSVLISLACPTHGLAIHDYPFNLSGGMRQRGDHSLLRPQLLLADDGSCARRDDRAQILDLLAQLQADMGMTVLMITTTSVSSPTRRVAVYLGKRRNSIDEQLSKSRCTYTQGLMASVPRIGSRQGGRKKRTPCAAWCQRFLASRAALTHPAVQGNPGMCDRIARDADVGEGVRCGACSTPRWKLPR